MGDTSESRTPLMGCSLRIYMGVMRTSSPLCMQPVVASAGHARVSWLWVGEWSFSSKEWPSLVQLSWILLGHPVWLRVVAPSMMPLPFTL